MDGPESKRPAWEQVEPTTEPEMEPTLQPFHPAGLPAGLPLWRVVLGLAIWPLLEQIMGALIWFVDTALAAHLEQQTQQATEAIGLAVYILWLMGLLQNSVGIGATAIIARRIGAGAYREAEAALGQSITWAALWGMANAVLFYATADLVGHLGYLGEESRGLCSMYLRILAVVSPFRSVMFIGAASLRGAGDTRSPFVIMVFVNAVNLAVSVPLVTLGDWGLRGIAVGTASAWVVGGIITLRLLARGRGGIRLHRQNLPLTRAISVRLIRISTPALLESLGHWMPTFLTTLIVGYLAKLGMEQSPIGTHNITLRLEGFSFLPGFAFAMAASTVTGQYLGARDPVKARRAAYWAWLYGGVVMGGMGLVFLTVPQLLVRIITNDPLFLAEAPPLLFIAGWAQIGMATAMVLSGAMRGAGDTRTTMIITYISTWGLRLPLAYLLGITFELGLKGVWIGLSTELTIRGLLFLWRFLHGGWTRVKV